MKFRRIVPLLGALLLLWSSCALAEDMQFVDAHGATGYYVDVDSIYYTQVAAGQPGEAAGLQELVQARVAVIKARQNRRYLYLMQFNRDKMAYRILSSKVQVYDTKKIIEENHMPTGEMPFAGTSPMQAVVDFIYEQPRNKVNNQQ